jgi:hypothetical protein
VKIKLRRAAMPLLVSAALIGCTSILGDFEITASPGGSSGADGDIDGTTPGVDGSSGGGGDSAPLNCVAPQVKCAAANVCAVLASDPEHCGECGHSCGGGTCENSVCKPAKLFDLGADAGTVTIETIDVDEVHLFYSTTDNNMENRLFSCPLAGCKGVQPQQLASMQYGIRGIAAMNKETFTFLSAPAQTTERPAIYACTPAGCPSPPVSFTGDGLNGVDSRFRKFGNRLFHFRGGSGIGFSNCPPTTPGTCAGTTALGVNTRGTHAFTADADKVYFVDSATRGSTIATCAQTDTACVPATLVAGDNSDVDGVEVEGGKMFWIRPGRDGFNEGKLFNCDLPACTAPPKLVANALSTSPNSPRELRVDASGAYWITTTSKIQRCAPNGCLGGAKDFAGPLVSPHALVTDGKFVYWAEKTSVWRLAK